MPLVDCSPEPLAWKSAVEKHACYRLSCAVFSLVGYAVHRNLAVFALHASPLYFQIGALCQGPLSYMADVHTYGRRSRWKAVDAGFACVGLLQVLLVPPLSLVGVMRFPARLMVWWSVCVAAAVALKRRGSLLLQRGRRHDDGPHAAREWARTHALWHAVPAALLLITALHLCDGRGACRL